MARHKSAVRSEVSEPDLDISSLIDICFLLLIYFLVSMTIVPREQDLGMRLPVPGENTGLSAIAPMFIRVDDSGAVFTGTGLGEQAMDANPESRDLPLLSSQLALYADAARSSTDTPLVQLLVGNGATQQRVVDVLNALASCQITAVTFTDLVER
jgi:biopolymer transport protein ExbD